MEDVTIQERNVTLVALKMEGGGHEPRNEGDLWKLEMDFSVQPPERRVALQKLYFSPVRLMLDF